MRRIGRASLAYCCTAALAALALVPTAAASIPSTEAVVRAWSAALDTGNDAAAGRLFDPHAIWVQGGYTFQLNKQSDAATLTRSLPCSGKIVAIAVKGERATATFLLGNRPGRAKCTTPGEKAAALFVVHRGKIVLWEQVPVPAPTSPPPPPKTQTGPLVS
jgi:hypothetical protein